MPDHPHIHASVFELASALEADWATRLQRLRDSGVPLNADEGGAGNDGGGEGAAGGDAGSGGGEGAAGGGNEADLPEGARKALAAAREDAKAAEKRAKAAEAKAKQLEEKDLTEQQRKDKELEEAKSESAKARAQLLRVEVAQEKGLTLSQAKRLVGTTKEELAKDADEFLKDLKSAGSSTSFDGGAQRQAAQTGDMDQLIRRSAGRS